MIEEGTGTPVVAATIGKVIDAVSAIGRYAAEVLGTAPHDFVGLAVGDKLRIRRIQNIEALAAEANPYLERIDPERIREPSPSVLIPLIAASADEERAELRNLWARLLANSAIDGGARVRREFFETVRKLEPLDAVVLDIFDEPPVKSPPNAAEQINAMRRLLENRHMGGTNDLALQVSMDALEQHRCIVKPGSIWVVSPYGRALKLACRVE